MANLHQITRSRMGARESLYPEEETVAERASYVNEGFIYARDRHRNDGGIQTSAVLLEGVVKYDLSAVLLHFIHAKCFTLETLVQPVVGTMPSSPTRAQLALPVPPAACRLPSLPALPAPSRTIPSNHLKVCRGKTGAALESLAYPRWWEAAQFLRDAMEARRTIESSIANVMQSCFRQKFFRRWQRHNIRVFD